ncbi:hypothetical protein BDN72DRAFT_474053 [Pluteus cervinus]|uniref:Uncharacterized protein n=1 Tax=Pluteus cervinus TaxID=181527 RepID=A0ACD3B0R5_9AGAR|nr:hypothetical protein BDN72DRAFT_474053 [Pluteus cervinus]
MTHHNLLWANSFEPHDINELVELRARQRTFYGAYGRTALVSLGYAITILRLLDDRFHKIGLLFAILAGALFVLSFLRAAHSNNDFADFSKEGPHRRYKHVIKTVGTEGTRIFGRPFITAGWIVLAVSIIVAVVEIALLVLILRIN